MSRNDDSHFLLSTAVTFDGMGNVYAGKRCREIADKIERIEAEIERLRELLEGPDPHYDMARENGNLRADNERLRAVIIRAKDALLDGQSAQWVHDLLVAAILDGEKG